MKESSAASCFSVRVRRAAMPTHRMALRLLMRTIIPLYSTSPTSRMGGQFSAGQSWRSGLLVSSAPTTNSSPAAVR